MKECDYSMQLLPEDAELAQYYERNYMSILDYFPNTFFLRKARKTVCPESSATETPLTDKVSQAIPPKEVEASSSESVPQTKEVQQEKYTALVSQFYESLMQRIHKPESLEEWKLVGGKLTEPWAPSIPNNQDKIAFTVYDPASHVNKDIQVTALTDENLTGFKNLIEDLRQTNLPLPINEKIMAEEIKNLIGVMLLQRTYPDFSSAILNHYQEYIDERCDDVRRKSDASPQGILLANDLLYGGKLYEKRVGCVMPETRISRPWL